MKNIIENLQRDRQAEELMELPCAGEKTKKVDGTSQKHLMIGAVVLTPICIALAVWLVLDMVFVGAQAAGNAFEAAKDVAASETYQSFYETSYASAEKAHHVSNRATISLGNLRETQKMEVLAVSEVSYQAESPEKDSQGILPNITDWFDEELVSWLEIPGNGVFTVDLQLGEFIIDNDRQSVLVRIPGPELTNFALDYENVEVLYFEEGGAFKNSAKYGTAKAMEQLQDAQLEMQQSVSNNQTLYKRARTAAENMLIRLVKELNPQMPDLVVEVEFLN